MSYFIEEVNLHLKLRAAKGAVNKRQHISYFSVVKLKLYNVIKKQLNNTLFTGYENKVLDQLGCKPFSG